MLLQYIVPYHLILQVLLHWIAISVKQYCDRWLKSPHASAVSFIVFSYTAIPYLVLLGPHHRYSNTTATATLPPQPHHRHSHTTATATTPLQPHHRCSHSQCICCGLRSFLSSFCYIPGHFHWEGWPGYAMHHCTALLHCTTTLHQCTTVLHHYIAPMHYCIAPLHYWHCTAPMHYCTSPMHFCTSPIHYCTSLLHCRTSPFHYWTSPLHCTTALL